MPTKPITWCHADDRMTTTRAYKIANAERAACPSCVRLAWFLVAIDLDSQFDQEEVAS